MTGMRSPLWTDIEREGSKEEIGVWFKQQRTILSEEKYLKLLCAYVEWKKERVY
jgi:hypothetical protein